MKFVRNIDPKDALNIGLKEVIRNIIRRVLSEVPAFTPGWDFRERIVEEITKYTGWKDVKDISPIGAKYVFDFTAIDEKRGEVRINVNIKE